MSQLIEWVWKAGFMAGAVIGAAVLCGWAALRGDPLIDRLRTGPQE